VTSQQITSVLAGRALSLSQQTTLLRSTMLTNTDASLPSPSKTSQQRLYSQHQHSSAGWSIRPSATRLPTRSCRMTARGIRYHRRSGRIARGPSRLRGAARGAARLKLSCGLAPIVSEKQHRAHRPRLVAAVRQSHIIATPSLHHSDDMASPYHGCSLARVISTMECMERTKFLRQFACTRYRATLETHQHSLERSTMCAISFPDARS
jgi:hypothetical protein